LSPIFNEFLGIAASVPPLTTAELLNAWADLDLLRAKTLEEMRKFPVLLCPWPACRVPHGSGIGYRRSNCRVPGRVAAHAVVQRVGAPAAVVPVGASPKGYRSEVQIVARPFEDETALGIAGIVDDAFGYKPPPLALG